VKSFGYDLLQLTTLVFVQLVFFSIVAPKRESLGTVGADFYSWITFVSSS